MSSKRSTFRPAIQMLETRRCMTAAVGELIADPTGGTEEIATIATQDDIHVTGVDCTSDVDAAAVDDDASTGAFLSNPNDVRQTRDILIVNNGDGPDIVDRDAGRHNYTTGGIFTITVTVTDDDTGQAVDATKEFFSEYGREDSSSGTAT